MDKIFESLNKLVKTPQQMQLANVTCRLTEIGLIHKKTPKEVVKLFKETLDYVMEKK